MKYERHKDLDIYDPKDKKIMLERGIKFLFDAREDNYQWMGRKWLA